jgi:hypothetical protein
VRVLQRIKRMQRLITNIRRTITDTTSTNERLKKEYTRGLRMILKTDLNTKNKIAAVGVLTIPVLKCCFSIINWR